MDIFDHDNHYIPTTSGAGSGPIASRNPEFGGTYPVGLPDALLSSPPLTGAKLAAKARLIASRAHDGQVDKIGAPYSGHINRTTARALSLWGRMLERELLDHHVVEATAVLHDTCEDTGVTAAQLRAAGIADEVVDAVVLLTHDGHSREAYLDRVASSLLATVVKIADTLDNTDPVRRRAIGDEQTERRLADKYAGQLERLIDATGGRVTAQMLI